MKRSGLPSHNTNKLALTYGTRLQHILVEYLLWKPRRVVIQVHNVHDEGEVRSAHVWLGRTAVRGAHDQLVLLRHLEVEGWNQRDHAPLTRNVELAVLITRHKGVPNLTCWPKQVHRQFLTLSGTVLHCPFRVFLFGSCFLAKRGGNRGPNILSMLAGSPLCSVDARGGRTRNEGRRKDRLPWPLSVIWSLAERIEGAGFKYC